jgi:hypothetical protein
VGVNIWQQKVIITEKLRRDDQLDEVGRSRVLINRVFANFSRRIFLANMFLCDSPCIVRHQTLPFPTQIIYFRAQSARSPLSPALSVRGTACKGEELEQARDSRRGGASSPAFIHHSAKIRRLPPDLCTCLLIFSALVASSLRIRAPCSCRASAVARQCPRTGAPSLTRRVSRQPARILLICPARLEIRILACIRASVAPRRSQGANGLASTLVCPAAGGSCRCPPPRCWNWPPDPGFLTME